MSDTLNQAPDQPDGIEDDSHDLPDPARAAERVRRFLESYGDGRIVPVVAPQFEDTMPPLYARDLEALATLAPLGQTEDKGNRVIECSHRCGMFTDTEHVAQANAREHYRYAGVRCPGRFELPEKARCVCGSATPGVHRTTGHCTAIDGRWL